MDASTQWIRTLSGAAVAATLLYPADRASTNAPRSIAFSVASTIRNGSAKPYASARDIKKFKTLVNQWRNETLDLSSLTEMVAHPAYLAIIGMGSVATPLLLSELRKRPGHWFVALEAINGFNPVLRQDAGNLRKMTEAWLKWGEGQLA